MLLLHLLYKIKNKNTPPCDKIPYYYNYNLWTIIIKPIRKFFVVVLIPIIPINFFRIILYKICGFHIGKNSFIGMRCYLDDTCYKELKIGNNVTVSYGCYFACHGRKQGHYPIVIDDGAYIGMRACIISKNTDENKKGVVIGKKAIVGACALVNKDIPEGATAVGIPCRIIS